MSKFKKRHLELLKDASTSYSSPLEVIVHIDLDAYYAQCEQIRLNLPPDAPVVCRQWDSLIAVNYPARKFGIRRGARIEDAKKACPELHAPHVATYKKGETKWAWHEEPDVTQHKVSLDPFRQTSRQIFKVFKKHCTLIEKAGIDEAFFDLGPYLYDKISQMVNLDDLERDDNLPPIPSYEQIGVEWQGIRVREELPGDWDDICVLLASAKVADVRRALYDEMKFRCSAGIARNKILAKLGSGKNKPNNQTVVTPSAIQEFLQGFDLTDMWGLGGKYGERIMNALDITKDENPMKYIQSLELDQLKAKLGQAEGVRIYNLVRGQEASEIVTRTDVKSMQSVKQFTQNSALKTYQDVEAWLKVFSSDLANRVLELDEELPTPIRPKTVVIGYSYYHKGHKVDHSKQSAFTSVLVKNVTFEKYLELVFNAGMSLLNSLKAEVGHPLLPCCTLRLALTSMEKIGAAGTKSLDGFFGKSLFESKNNSVEDSGKADSPVSSVSTSSPVHGLRDEHEELEAPPILEKSDMEPEGASSTEMEDEMDDVDDDLFVTEETMTTKCERCNQNISVHKMDEHRDWHFAKDLSEQVNKSLGKRSPNSPSKKTVATKRQKTMNPSKKDQSILKFFKKSA